MNASLTFGRLLKRSFLLWFGGIWMLVGVPLLVAGLLAAAKEQRYSEEGAEADGVVTRKEIRRGKSTSYRVYYRFRARDGGEFSGRDSTRRARWEELREGGAVRIEYLPSNPAQNRLAGKRNVEAAYILIPLGATFGGVGGFLFFKDLARIRLALRLSREGILADADVTAVEETKVSINRVRQWVVRYSYRDFQGREHAGKSEYLPPEEAAEWKPGDGGQVRYDQNRPEQNVWLGRPGAGS